MESLLLTTSAENYRSVKVAFVSDMSGSSVGHINLLSLAALVR